MVLIFYKVNIASSIPDEGVTSSEKEINDIINNMCLFNDTALLRREMYNYRFINRTLDGKIYWKEKVQPIPEQYDYFNPVEKDEIKIVKC